jgi:signal transduction histidine kinase/ActR/RegA family two-component response regulator
MCPRAIGDAFGVFPGDGPAHAVIHQRDWSSTPLGSVADWSISLRAHVRAMLATRQPTSIFWGGDYVNLYNDGFIPLLGQKHPRAMGEGAREVWSDAWPVVGELLRGVLTRGEAVRFAEALVPIVRDGQLEDAWWNYSYSPLADDDGSIRGILVVATEMTAEVRGRKQLEAARAEAEVARQELHGVFMQAPFPMALLKGGAHRFALVNAPYRALVGDRALDNLELGDVFADDEVGYYRPHLDQVLATGNPVVLREAPLLLVDASGTQTQRYIDVGYYPYLDATGDPTGVLAVIHDVTEKVEARLTETRLRESAEAANRAKDTFLATISHELRTPLSAILGWARMLRTGDLAANKVEHALEVIERNSLVQVQLIDDLLDVSRIISGKLRLDVQSLQIVPVVEAAVESMRHAIEAKQIRFSHVIDPSAGFITGDSHRLQQVIWNLLSNAVKFTPKGGTIRLIVARVDSSIELTVQDSGQGMSKELLPSIFERFKQADGSMARVHGGLGLGLAITRHIVELHGGTIEVHSEGEGRGATFVVRLPIAPFREQRDGPFRHPMASDLRPQFEHPKELQGLTVLVVDDEKDTRDVLTEMLRQVGSSVLVAAGARDALSVLDRASPRILVCDIGMPEMDGYQFIEEVRKRPREKGGRTVALALTAYASPEDRRRALRAGFQMHLGKPVEPAEFVAVLANLAQLAIALT